MVEEKTVLPKKSSFWSWLPLGIIITALTLVGLNQGGYIDLPHLGQQNQYPLEPPDDDSTSAETIPLTEGTVGTAYYDNTLVQVRDQMISKKACQAPCKLSIEEFDLPAGLKFNPDSLTISGIPIQAETWTFVVCWADAEDEGCFDNDFSITIKPKPVPPRSDCPTKPNPPCGSNTASGEITPTAIGTLTYEGCKCPEGTHDSGERDRVTTPGTVYMMCLCD